MASCSEFFDANLALWNLIMDADPSVLKETMSILRSKHRMLTLASISLSEYVSSYPVSFVFVGYNTLKLIGYHILAYHAPETVDSIIENAVDCNRELLLADNLGMKVEEMRRCLVAVVEMFNNQVTPLNPPKAIPGECSIYVKNGVFLFHLGILASCVEDYDRVQIAPRDIVYNSLLYGVLNDLAALKKAPGAGGIFTVQATIGRGKTTLVYHTLRSLLRILGASEAEADKIAKSLIILDSEEFLNVAEEVIERKIKVPVMIVDNASDVLTKYWTMYSGEMRKRYFRINRMFNSLRDMTSVMILIANAKDDLASFVRKKTTIDLVGYPVEHPGFIITVFVKPSAQLARSIRHHHIEERVIGVHGVDTVFVYPLLRLPGDLYKKDMEVKHAILEQVVRELRELREKQGGEEGESEDEEG